jgi:hypothetical protein
MPRHQKFRNGVAAEGPDAPVEHQCAHERLQLSLKLLKEMAERQGFEL